MKFRIQCGSDLVAILWEAVLEEVEISGKTRVRTQIWFDAKRRERCEAQLISWPSPRTWTTGHAGKSDEI